MESKERTLGNLSLENGLSVYFTERTSPPVAGRCQVQLLIRVPVEPTKEHFSSYPDPSGALLRFLSLAGPGPIEFQTVKVRNFIDGKDVEKTSDIMKNEFIQANLGYLKNPRFVPNFLVKSFEEFCKKELVQRAHREAVRKIEGN